MLRCSPWALLLLLFSLSAAWRTAAADAYDDRRVRTGARLLRSLLAADLGLEQKAAQRGAVVGVWILGSDHRAATDASALIAADSRTTIRGLPVAVRWLPRWPETQLPAPLPTCLMLSTPVEGARLAELVRWSREHGVILYSPFEGDVEAGATAGLAIGAKVQPLINREALAATGITLKPFFLKVAKVWP